MCVCDKRKITSVIRVSIRDYLFGQTGLGYLTVGMYGCKTIYSKCATDRAGLTASKQHHNRSPIKKAAKATSQATNQISKLAKRNERTSVKLGLHL